MSKSKRGKNLRKRPVVRGPQLALLGKSKGEPARTARMRFVEPPSKVWGNPFVAVRVPRDVLAAFKKKAASKKLTANAVIRSLMARYAGVKLSTEGEE